jgi:hypothetical protein
MPFQIPEDEALYIDQDGANGGVEVSASTLPKNGNRATDIMDKYGTEQPVPGVDY